MEKIEDLKEYIKELETEILNNDIDNILRVFKDYDVFYTKSVEKTQLIYNRFNTKIYINYDNNYIDIVEDEKNEK